MMRAILIDPSNKSVTEIEHSGQYKDIVETLGIRMIEAVGLGLDHHMYVDEEGLLVADHPNGYFKLPQSQVYAGKAIIFRGTPDGEEAPATIGIEHVRRIVQFVTPTEEDLEPHVELIPMTADEMREFFSGRRQ
jgi:hypothetical protein